MGKLTSFFFVGVVFLPTIAFAETTVTVLGLRSAAADEEVAAQVTTALRGAADMASSSGLTHTGRENELQQLLIVFECPDPTPQCLREIGQNLESQRLIYGSIEPESGRSDAAYRVSLSLFNVESGQVEREIHEAMPRDLRARQLAEPASRFYAALTGSGTQAGGELALRCSVSGAQVLINGQEMGTITDGTLRLRDLEPGEVTVQIRHEDYESVTRTVTIEPGEVQRLEVNMSRGLVEDSDDDGVEEWRPGEDGDPDVASGDRNLAWLGWTMLGTGVALGAVGLASSLIVYGVNNDLEEERRATPEGLEVCDLTNNGGTYTDSVTAQEVHDLCDRAHVFQILQWVFYGTFVTLAPLGIWLGVREVKQSRQSSVGLTLQPVFSARGGYLSATVSF